jgi:hypothetical protein
MPCNVDMRDAHALMGVRRGVFRFQLCVRAFVDRVTECLVYM